MKKKKNRVALKTINVLLVEMEKNSLVLNCDLSDKSKHNELFEWLKVNTEKFIMFFKPILKNTKI